MWFTFVTARLFISLSFQPRLTATLLSSCSVVNSPIRRVGLSPTFRSVSLAQVLLILSRFQADGRMGLNRSWLCWSLEAHLEPHLKCLVRL